MPGHVLWAEAGGYYCNMLTLACQEAPPQPSGSCGLLARSGHCDSVQGRMPSRASRRDLSGQHPGPHPCLDLNGGKGGPGWTLAWGGAVRVGSAHSACGPRDQMQSLAGVRVGHTPLHSEAQAQWQTLGGPDQKGRRQHGLAGGRGQSHGHSSPGGPGHTQHTTGHAAYRRAGPAAPRQALGAR